MREALGAGTLSAARWTSYEKLQKEAAFDVRRVDSGAARAEQAKWKQIHKEYRKRPKKE